MAYEKLPKEIELKRTIVSDLGRVANVAAFDRNDLTQLQHQIDANNAEIMTLIGERDKRDETTDKLSIYRHQAAAVGRKKAILVDKLHQLRTEHQNLQNEIDTKRNEIRNKTGNEFVITPIQFKNYVAKLRNKMHSYKRQRLLIDDLKSERSILVRTADILDKQWDGLRDKIEVAGGRIIKSNADLSSHDRPKTAKPSTENIDELRSMIEQMSDEFDSKMSTIKELKHENDELNEQRNEISERYNTKKRNYEIAEASMESSFIQLQQTVRELEEKLSSVEKNLATMNDEDKEASILLRRLEEEEQEHYNRPKMIDEIEERIKILNDEAQSLQHPRVHHLENGMTVEQAVAQVAMWRSLVKIFKAKIEAVHDKIGRQS